tara:strand:+ start:3258 stop:6131 length:2874 start_codon:yes stop_codon:yes gene_type:complete
MASSSSNLLSYSKSNTFFPLNRNVFLTQQNINNKRNINYTSTLKNLMQSLDSIPDYIKIKEDKYEFENVFAVLSVYVTFIDDDFKLILNNFKDGFFYTNKVYQFDLSHYTNFGHILHFSSDNSLKNNYKILRYGIPGTSGAYIRIKPPNNELIYVYTILQGLTIGSFYNPISTIPDTELSIDCTTITVTVEFINNGYKFVFDNYSENILSANKQFKFDVSNHTNSGFNLKFSLDSSSKQVYNTISIGTPGTQNACVYFFAHHATSIYIFDETTGYSAGDLYNPLYTYNKIINHNTLINNKVISGTNSKFASGITMNKTKLAFTTSYNTWELHDLSNSSINTFSISTTDIGYIFKNRFDDILLTTYQITTDCVSCDPFELLKSTIFTADNDSLYNTVVKNINSVNDIYTYPYNSLFTEYARNIYLTDDEILLSCSNINNIYSILKFSYQHEDASYRVDSFYETKILLFGECVVKFNNEYICSAHKNSAIYRLDMSLNMISNITYKENSFFGKQIISNNDFLFVSAPHDNNYEGSVLCYDKNFVNIQIITVNNSIKLGSSISINAFNTLIVGARNIVYEYLYNGETFKESHIFEPPETTQYDISGTSIYENFGNNVIIDSNNYIYISASYLNYKSGIVYIYKRVYNTQTLIQKINTSEIINNNEFGDSIALGGNNLIISSKKNNGKIYIYSNTQTINQANNYNSGLGGIVPDVTKLLGSIMFEPSDGLVNNADSNLVISIWSTAPENVDLPSIDITVKKTITIFYDLLNEMVLDFSNNTIQLSLLDAIKLYREANFDSLINVFGTTNNNYSLELGKVRESALAALTKSEQLYFKDKTEGVYISVEEYNILNNYISSLYKTIDGITNGISIYKNFITLQETVAAHKISYDILNDTTKLVEFIQSKNDNTSLSGLDVTTTLTVDPQLQSHIQTYISLYGWPDNFVFDSDLMAQILLDENSV